MTVFCDLSVGENVKGHCGQILQHHCNIVQMPKYTYVFALVLKIWVYVDAYEDFQNITVSIPTKVNQIGPWFGLDVGGNITIGGINSTDGNWPPSNPPSWSKLYLVLFSKDQWVRCI